MKRIIYSSLAIISVLFLILSCAKENNEFESINEGGIQVTINAGKAALKPSTKTEIEGITPYWSVGDKIGVSNGTTSNASFSTGIAVRASTASFSGTVESAGDYYAYYPYTTNGVGTISEKQGAKVDLPAEQYPTATSFDGSADIMVSKKFTVTGTNPTVDDLQFARLGAIVKIVLDDSEDVMTSQHPSTVSMTAANPLAGRVLVNMQEQSMGDPYYNASTTVTANYTAGTKYEINGTNATYLIVIPQTLAAGSSLTIAASTEGYSIEKTITVPAGGITLEAGKITTLNITLTSSHISASSGLALPFNDDFSWQTGSTNSTAVTFASDPGIPAAKYSAQNKVYQGNSAGEIKFGTASATGYITTVELDLSSAFYVHLIGRAWDSGVKFAVSVDDGEPKTVTMTASDADYYINFAAATNKSKVKVETNTKNRAFLGQLDIVSGAHAFPTHTITIDGGISHGSIATSPSGSAEEGAEVTITATPEDGYALTSISVTDASSNDVPVSENKFTMPTSNVTVTATFAKLYTVTWSNPDHGSITVKNGSTTLSSGDTVPEGATVTITDSADDGYSLSTLKYNDGSDHDIKAAKSFTMPSHNVSITATFTSGGNETMTFSELYDSNTTIDGTTINGTNFSVVFTKRDGGTATQYYTSGSAVRWYGGGTLVVSAKGGKTITGITLSFGGTKANAITASPGTYTDGSANGTGTWAGSASSVTFTQAGTSGQDRISAITVTYTE